MQKETFFLQTKRNKWRENERERVIEREIKKERVKWNF